MSDGRIVIDVELDDSHVRADARVIEQILRGLGGNAGQSMQSSFNHASQQVQHQASQTAGQLQHQLGRQINVNVNTQQAQSHLEGLKTIFEGTFLANIAEKGIETVKEGLSELIKTGIEYNATQDKMSAVWGVLTGSASKGKEMVNMVNDFQRATGYATETLNEMEQKIYHIKGSASETKEMTKAFTTLGDAMGLSDDKLLGVSEQFAQMMSNGKAYSGDLNIMTNAFPAFGDALKEHMHMGMAEIRKLASQGKLSATEVEDTLLDMQKKYAGATEAVMSTTQGLWRSMESNFGRLAGAFTKPIFDMKKAGFKDLSEWLSSDEATKMATRLGDALAGVVGHVVDFIGYLAKHKDTILTFAKAIAEAVGAFLLFKGIEGAISTIGTMYKAVQAFFIMFTSWEAIADALDPFAWIALAITAIGIACFEAYKHSATFRGWVNTAWKDLKQGWEWVSKFGEAIKDLFGGMDKVSKGTSIMEKLGLSSKQQVEISKAVGKVKEVFGVIKQGAESIGTGLQKAGKWIGQFIEGVKDLFGGIDGITKGTSILTKLGLDPAEQKVIATAVGKIKEAFKTFKDTVKEVWDYIEPTIVKGMKTVWGAIQTGLDTVKKYWNKIFPELQPALDGLMKVLDWMYHIVFLPITVGIGIALGALKNSWKKIWDTICDLLKGAWDLISGVIKVGWDVISGVFQVIIDLLSGKFSKAWKDMKDTVGKTLGDLWDMVKKVAKDIGGAFVDLGKAIANGIIGGLAGGVNAVVDGINWILDKVNAPQDMHLKYWKNIPQFANGTDGHKGGLAIVGDGGKKELIQTPDGQMMLSPNTSTLMNLPKGTQVLDGHNTERMMGMGLIPAYANGTGGFLGALNSAWNWGKSGLEKLGDMAKNFWNLATHPDKLIQSAIANFAHLGKFAQPALGMAEGTISTGAKGALNWITGLLGGSSDNPANNTAPNGKVSGSVAQWLQKAMSITNTPSGFLGALEAIAMHESGGNPHAINLWDSNAKAGHPSKGLMQTIDGTFNRYAIAGLGDIWNPVANAVASIRYMNSRYGSVANVPGIRAMASGHGYVGYANGTGGSVGGNVVVGEYEPELIQTPDGKLILANHATSFNDFVAGATVTPLSKLANGVMAKAKSVLNKVGNPTLNTPLVKASIANGKDTTVEVNIQPIVVQSVLDGKVIAETVTNVQNQNSVRTSRLRGEI
jgi:tape measure domain-containing protein